MRLLHGADAHLGFVVPGYPNANAEALDRFVDEAIAREVDLAVWSGDTFHSRRPTPAQLRVAVRAAVRLRDAGIPLVIGTGNHDGYSEIGEPDSHVLGWWADLGVDGVTVMIERGLQVVQTRHGSLRVAHLPYPHRRAIASDESLPDRMRAAARQATEHLEQLAEGRPDLLVAHLSIEGAMIGAESAMRMGWDATIAEDAVAVFGYAALGHIHRQQQILHNVWYPGSPIAMGWSSGVDHGDGWLQVDINAAQFLLVKPVPGGGPAWARYDVREDEDWTLPAEIPLGAVVKAVLHPRSKLSAETSRRVLDGLHDRGAGYVRLEVMRENHPLLPPAGAHGLEPFDLDSLMREWLDARQIPADEPVAVAREIVESVRRTR